MKSTSWVDAVLISERLGRETETITTSATVSEMYTVATPFLN
jgi:hypothetical protein